MELAAYLRIIRRWLWLIIFAIVVAGSIGFALARLQPDRYQANITIQIGTYSTITNPDLGMISTATQLTQTYAALVKTSPILQAVIDKFQLHLTTVELAKQFDVHLVTGTSLMTITVNYTDPVLASNIANELAAQLIAYSPSTVRAQKDQAALLQKEIDSTNKQLQQAHDELNTIEAALPTKSGQELTLLTARRTELLTEINTEQTNLASMSSTLTTLQDKGENNSVRVVDPAPIPTVPTNLSPIVTALLAAIIGGIAALGGAMLIDYLNNSIRTPSEIMPLLNLPLLGSIAPHGRKGSYKNRLIAWTQPRSTIAEAYRAIRVNLLYREGEEVTEPTCRTYVVTSAGPAEGKSFNAANLAVTFAITGMRVLVIDTDLRRPTAHLIFNIPNMTGLSNIWGRNDAEREKALLQVPAGSNGNLAEAETTLRRRLQLMLSTIVQKTEVPRLDVITAGPSVSNPAELLDTVQLKALLAEIRESGLYDVVIFNSPPTLVVTDASIIANTAKAKVVLVVESGRTSRPSAARAVENLQALSIPLIGVIMNRLKPQDRDSDYGYNYYYGYSRYGETTNKPVPTGEPK